MNLLSLIQELDTLNIGELEAASAESYIAQAQDRFKRQVASLIPTLLGDADPDGFVWSIECHSLIDCGWLATLQLRSSKLLESIIESEGGSKISSLGMAMASLANAEIEFHLFGAFSKAGNKNESNARLELDLNIGGDSQLDALQHADLREPYRNLTSIVREGGMHLYVRALEDAHSDFDNPDDLTAAFASSSAAVHAAAIEQGYPDLVERVQLRLVIPPEADAEDMHAALGVIGAMFRLADSV